MAAGEMMMVWASRRENAADQRVQPRRRAPRPNRKQNPELVILLFSGWRGQSSIIVVLICLGRRGRPKKDDKKEEASKDEDAEEADEGAEEEDD